MDGADRAALRVCLLDGLARALAAEDILRAPARPRRRGRRSRTPLPRRTIPTTPRGRRWRGITCGIISVTCSVARSSRGWRRFIVMPPSSSLVVLRREPCSSTMPSINQLADNVRAGRRVTADQALALYHEAPLPLLGELADGIRAARIRAASSPTSSTATSTTPTSASRAATSARSTARSDRPRATSSASTRFSARSTRPSRSVACSCCCRAATTPICRSSGTRTCSAP